MIYFINKPSQPKNALVMFVLACILSYFPIQGHLYGKITIFEEAGRPTIELTKAANPEIFAAAMIVIPLLILLSLFGMLLELFGVSIGFGKKKLSEEQYLTELSEVQKISTQGDQEFNEGKTIKTKSLKDL